MSRWVSLRTAQRLIGAPVALAVLAMTVAACGSGSGSGPTDGDGTSDVTIGYVKVAGAAPILVAQEQGFFADHGLDVTLRELQGPAISAALLNGEVQFGSLGSSVVVTAAAQGLPLQIVVGREQTAPTQEVDPLPFMVMPDSGIESASDLEGKTVGVNSLGSINALFTRRAIREAGGDPSKVEFIEIGFPDMVAALSSGTIAGASLIEPTATQARDAGAVTLFGAGSSAFPSGAPIGVVATTSDYVEDNQETVEAVREALQEGLAWCSSDEARFRQELPDLVGLSPQQAESMILPVWNSEVTPESLTEIGDELVEQGFIDAVPDPEKLILR